MVRKARISHRKQKSNPTSNIWSWFIKSLAWAFVLACLSWAGYLQGGFDSVKKTNAEQDTKIEVLDQTTSVNLMYIRESLSRIETQLNKEK